MTKEQALILMRGYVDSYKKENEIYDFLSSKGIYIDIQSTPIGIAIENVLTMLSFDMCNCLIELADNNEVILCNPKRTVTTVEELYDELVGDSDG